MVATGLALLRTEGLGEVELLLVVLAVTAVLVIAGSLMASTGVDAFERLRSVLWFAAIGSWGIATEQFLNVLELDTSSDARAVLSGVSSVVAATVLWVLLRRSFQLLALFFAALGAVIVVLGLTAGASDEPDPALVAAVVWVFGFGWTVMSDRSVLRPRVTGLVLGSLTVILAPFVLASTDPSGVGSDPGVVTAATAWSLTTSVLVLALGSMRRVRAAEGIGIAGILLSSALLIGLNFSSSDGAAIGALVIGVVLLGGATISVRWPWFGGSGAADQPLPPPPSV